MMHPYIYPIHVQACTKNTYIHVLYCIAFIHFYSSSHSISLSETLPITAVIMYRNLHAKALKATASEWLEWDSNPRLFRRKATNYQLATTPRTYMYVLTCTHTCLRALRTWPYPLLLFVLRAHLTWMTSLSRRQRRLWLQHEPLTLLALHLGTNSLLWHAPSYLLVSQVSLFVHSILLTFPWVFRTESASDQCSKIYACI